MLYHCPIEYNISNIYYHKEHQNGTGKELTQIKTLIEQYDVYNIISPQTITLQTPIVTRSSIVDVGKVSQIQLSFIYTLNRKAKQLSMKITLVPNY